MARLLLLLPTSTYRTQAFVAAAARLGLELTVGSELPSTFERKEPAGLLTLPLGEPAAAAEQVRAFAARHPVAAVFGVDDQTAIVAAHAARALGLPHNPVAAVEAAGHKHAQRVTLRRAGVPVPPFRLHRLSEEAAGLAASSVYPCVLKPLALSASRGVIRADDAASFLDAQRRLRSIVQAADAPSAGDGFLVEQFVPGVEFALEGLVVSGRLHVLALFDKPDPMNGPFFPETIYTTPSRAPKPVQRELVRCGQRAVTALGLERGPVHVELRSNERGVWLIELAARPIGGRCGEVLRFGVEGGTSLEELLLAHATGLRPDVPEREPCAAGVMMLPVPRAGAFREARGLDRARAVPAIVDVVVTAYRGQAVAPLPEEARYLGFIFARAATPVEVEQAIREAHGELELVIETAASPTADAS